ncbi:MAG TPA: DoxX-like family protein [Fimbriimonadaceae bacterium]|nr:DoxX-like family protein [Fimbriimonadaceae bacterium]
MAIYVEIDIAADLERVWELTQSPDLHERWDLRFSGIEYLPKVAGEPQRFRYSTRLGFGMRVEGVGESVAERSSDGCAVSSLKFWSDDPKSLIREGSGFWKYSRLNGKTRFVTGFDYEPRYGLAGRLFDRFVFRPLIGWATAWSFDSMRLWIERSVPPEVARRHALIHLAARLGLAVVWVYQGLVPKLLFPQAGEAAIMRQANLPLLPPTTWLVIVGVLEVVYGVLVIACFRSRWVIGLQIPALVALSLAALLTTPKLFVGPFNPLTLNVALLALVAVALFAEQDLPSARGCRRKKAVERA